MAITLLAPSNRGANNTINKPIASLNTNGGTMLSSASKNNGGVLGGIGYVGEKIGLGALASVEGIWDYIVGGVADMFGYDEWAERQFANDWVNYSHADEWYNPSDGWKIAGDVAGGIGSSLPAIGAAIVTGGLGAAPLLTTAISSSIAGFGAAGQATKEAFLETGELTGKEYGYGALSGTTEAALEAVTAGLGKGSGRIIKAIGNKTATKLAADTAKEAAQTIAKKGAKSVFRQIGEDFVSEAIEEGLSEFLAPQYQKITYNPDAENATLQEISYAALIGGLSGAIMSGSSSAIRKGANTTTNLVSGKKSAESGSYKSIIKNGKLFAKHEAEASTGIEVNEAASKAYNKLIESLKQTNNIATTEEVLSRVESGNISFNTKERMLLGELKRTTTGATVYPFVERSAVGLISNPEAAAQRYSAFGIKDADGKPISVTAQDITSGIDENLLAKFKEGTLTKKESVEFAKSYRKALSENSVLTSLAIAEATGQIVVDTKRIAESILNGENLANTADINRLIERGGTAEKAALAQALGIKDINALTKTELGLKLADYMSNNSTSEWASQMKRIREAAQINENSATPIPETLRKNMNDGVYRLTNNDKSINIALIKEGESFHIFDYDGQRISRSLTSKEMNAILKDIRESSGKSLENQFEDTSALSEEAAKIDELLREKLPNYKSMSEPNKEAMRMTMRQALASGMSQESALVATRVAQRSGLNVIFDGIQAQGDGALSGNTIYVNPKLSDKRVCEVVLGHEMFHKIFASGTKKSMKLYEQAKAFVEGSDTTDSAKVYKAVNEAVNTGNKVNTEGMTEADAVRAKYKTFYKKQNAEGTQVNAIAEEEVAAAGVEKVLNSKEAWEFILDEEPSLSSKVLSFFGKASKDYASLNSLSSQARKFLISYKKLFNEISAKNQGNNALSIALEKAGVKKMPSSTAPYTRANADGTGAEKDIEEVERYAEEVDLEKRHSFSSISYSFFGDKQVTVEDFENGSYKDTEGYKEYVNKCLNNMKQTREGFTEESARKEVEKSIKGIVDVAVAMKKAGYDILDTEGKRETRDSKNRLLFSSLEPNSDYITSSDISTICDKRVNFQEIYDEIVRRETELKVPKGKRFFDNVDNYFIIHKIMADKGLTQPCRECYVESMRKNLAPMANAFLQLVQETNPENKSNPQLYNKSGKNKGELKSNNAKLREKLLKAIETEEYDITVDKLDEEMLSTDKGLTTLRLQAPLIYEAFNSFYGQSKPKMPKSATPFRFGELTALLTNDKGKINKALVEKIKSTGGFRLQSYSDFQIQNFADVLQVIFEAGTLGLNGHAYTKVPAFLDATKGTNLKRNISIFMYKDGKQWKLDRNDSFPYELDKIYDIVNADESGNTSIIAVVQNEDMAAYVMANDNIGYFIPFHKSGLKMATVRETIVKEGGREIKGYSGIKDHTRQQTEVWAFNENGHKAYTKVDKGINIYEFWDFDNKENLSKNKLIENNLKRYIDECKKLRYVPKFREYLLNNDKVLENTLSYAKELGTVSSDATIEDISFEYKGYRIPYGYYKCLGDFGMFKPNGKASPIETLSLKDYNFKEAVDFFSDAKTLRRNEILQQIANGEERERYRNSDMTTAEIAQEVQNKRNAVVESVVTGEYKDILNKRFAIAGETSETADTSLLSIAEEMLDDGINPETIRKETGWFKGYEGRWKYEIDDSVAVWHFDTAKPDPKKLVYFGERIFKLPDLLEHPELYKAYPQLMNVTVWENSESKTTGYVVGRSTEAITIKSLEDTNFNKDILMHEIQHIIQNIEGFATGASIEQFDYKSWGEKEYQAYEKRNEIAQKLYAILRRHGVSITKADVNAVRWEFGVTDSIIDYNYLLLGSLADSNPRTEALLDEYQKQAQILRLTTPEGQYHAVAGEIEAYNVQGRRRLTAEQRKNTRPNIDREDAIIENNSSVSFFGKNERNNDVDSIRTQLFEHVDEIKTMSPVADINYKYKSKEAAKKDAYELYKTKGLHIERQHFGIIELSENEIDDSARYVNTPAEAAVWMVIPNVLKRGRFINTHSDHKGEGFPTYTIAAPVIINGRVGIVGVVVKKTGKYRYKAHRIITPDKSVFVFNETIKNAEPTGSDILIENNEKGPDISSASGINISHFVKKVNPSDENSSEISNKRFALTDADIADGSIERLQRPSFKERVAESFKEGKENFVPGIVATEIQLTNAQAGIEHAGRRLGMKNVESLVQRCRASRAIAQEMLGGGQWAIAPNATKNDVRKLGDGLEPILAEIRDKREGESKSDAEARYTAYQYYLYHKHNVDRMSLEQRSLSRHQANITKYKSLQKTVKALKKRIESNEAIKESLKGKYNQKAKSERARIKVELTQDRASLIETLKEMTTLKHEIETFVPEENKPVLRKIVENDIPMPVTAAESEVIAFKYEQAYPEFADNAKKVYKFLNNLLDMQVESGLIDSKTASNLKQKYPHYVPTYRVEHKMGTAAVRGKNNIEVNQTVKKATGSLETLEDLELSISRMVQRVVSASNVNVLANEIYTASLNKNNTVYLKEVSRSKADNIIEGEGTLDVPKKNQINIYRNGERITLAVTHEIFLGFDEFNTRDEATILPIRAVSKVTSVFKSLVTSANPIFLVRNFIRDLQDAGINTKYSVHFVKNYARAIYHLSQNTEYAQLYRAAGGFSASIFDYVDGFVGKQSKMGFTNSTNKAKWLLNKVENANMFIEQLPRFAEFISALEAGATVDQAILDAADVTTNFGRSGKLTRKLNSTIIPFLNPAVQGLSKVYRNFKGAFKSPKAFAELLIKCLILGIIPMALNNLLYNDDEEYDDIKDTDKENNYLFKVGDTWIKIPKGRFVSVLAGATNRTAEEISGGDADWKEYFENVISQITPVENFTRPIWSPFTDVANNKTWYGGEIEGRQFENVRPGERYDESTSEIAKWIGDKINYSPKKIHYLLDQYSGVIGDFVLPATTQKAEKSFVASAFIFDPVTSNKLSNEFYELYEEATYNKTSGDITSIYQLKHLNEVKSAISDMYDEITKIQQSDLSNAEKLQQTRVLRILINNAYKTAITDYEGYTEAINATAGLFDESTESGVKMRYTEITHQFYGAEKAFEVYSSTVYEKMQYLNLSGIDYEELYKYYFGTKDIESDFDKNGNAISGTKRKKVVSAINKLNVKREQKLLLLCALGYAIKDGDIRGMTAESAKKLLLQYILRLKVTKAEKEELAKICGFEVKNGRIILKSS